MKKLIILFIAVIVISGAFWWWQNIKQIPVNLPSISPKSEKSTTFSIQGIQMTIPNDWNIDKQTESEIYIKTNYKPYDVFLVLNIEKNKEQNIEWYKKNRDGFDYTEVKNGEIFKIACGGGTCNGAILNNDVYVFKWNIKSNQPAPKNLTGIWEPDNNISSNDIWNILQSIKINN